MDEDRLIKELKLLKGKLDKARAYADGRFRRVLERKWARVHVEHFLDELASRDKPLTTELRKRGWKRGSTVVDAVVDFLDRADIELDEAIIMSERGYREYLQKAYQYIDDVMDFALAVEATHKPFFTTIGNVGDTLAVKTHTILQKMYFMLHPEQPRFVLRKPKGPTLEPKPSAKKVPVTTPAKKKSVKKKPAKKGFLASLFKSKKAKKPAKKAKKVPVKAKKVAKKIPIKSKKKQ